MKPTFTAASHGYYSMFLECHVPRDRMKEVDALVARITANRINYAHIASYTGVPWFVIGILHAMECDLNFSKHLANGDDLGRRTINDPAGLPAHPSQGPDYRGPFSFDEAAIAALEFDRLDEVRDWTVARILWEFEQFNGFGYRAHGVNSPYLWAGSNHYTTGKFIADGIWRARAVSKQIGAAVLLNRMCVLRAIALDAQPV